MRHTLLFLLLAILILACSGSAAAPAAAPSPKPRQVRYLVAVSGVPSTTKISVTYKNKNGNTEQATNAAFPFNHQFSAPAGQFIYISGQVKSSDPDARISCVIYIDGETFTDTNSTGGSAIATCSGSVP
jgi:hypothetical protein